MSYDHRIRTGQRRKAARSLAQADAKAKAEEPEAKKTASKKPITDLVKKVTSK
jgi:hypothetical protein